MAAEGTERRRLAAIMFTDMVGYTALAQRSVTLALRDLFPKFGDLEIETTGDGTSRSKKS